MGGGPSIPSSFISKDIVTSANHRSSWSRLSCWILGEWINELLPFLDENQRPSKNTGWKKWNAVQWQFPVIITELSGLGVLGVWEGLWSAKGSSVGRSIKQWNSSMSKSRMNPNLNHPFFLVGFMSLKTRGCFFTQLDAWSSCMEPFLSLFVDKWRQIALDLQWRPCMRIVGDS